MNPKLENEIRRKVIVPFFTVIRLGPSDRQRMQLHSIYEYRPFRTHVPRLKRAHKDI